MSKTLFFDVSTEQARDASRLAVQSAAAAAIMYLLMRWFGLPERFVGVISAVLVVQPSIGNTVREASGRVVATIIGSLVGAICLWLLPAGYGTAAALALSMLVMNGIAGLRPGWRYGVVAAVALSLGAESNVLDTAIDRAIAIGLGSMVGALATLTIWPDSARKRTQRHLRSAFDAIATMLDTVVDDAQDDANSHDSETRQRYHDNMSSARRSVKGIVFGDSDALDEKIRVTSRLYTSILIINRVAEEDGRVTEGANRLRELVGEIREQACTVISALAKGRDEDWSSRIEAMQTALDTAIDEVAEDESSATSQLRRSAMVFGLKQVVANLRDLVDQGSNQEPPHEGK